MAGKKLPEGYYDPSEYTMVHKRWLEALTGDFSRLVSRVTRVEVIDENGRVYTRWNCGVEASLQDDGRTLKLFVKAMELAPAADAVDPPCR